MSHGGLWLGTGFDSVIFWLRGLLDRFGCCGGLDRLFWLCLLLLLLGTVRLLVLSVCWRCLRGILLALGLLDFFRCILRRRLLSYLPGHQLNRDIVVSCSSGFFFCDLSLRQLECWLPLTQCLRNLLLLFQGQVALSKFDRA